MADIRDIATGSLYTGNAALGGQLGAPITISPNPLDRLAQYTFYRDRDLWEQKVAQEKVAADQIATITAFDINSPLKPYTDDLIRRRDEIYKFLRERPTATNYSKDKEGFQKLNTMVGEFKNARTKATSNGVLYEAGKAKVDAIPNAAQRTAEQGLLDLRVDDLFANGVEDAYNKTFQTAAEIKPDDYGIPKLPYTDKYTITRNANDIEITGKAFIDLDAIDSGSQAEYNKLLTPPITTTPQWAKMTDREKKRALLEEEIKGTKRKELDSIAATSKTLVDQLLQKYGKAKVEDLTDAEIQSAGSLGGYIAIARDFNKKVAEANLITGRNFQRVNLEDGATGTEIIKLKGFADNGGTLYKELQPEIKVTNIAVTKRGQDLDLEAAKIRSAEKTTLLPSMTQPLDLIEGHIKTLKDRFAAGEKTVTVAFSGLDDATKQALGITPGMEGEVDPKTGEKTKDFIDEAYRWVQYTPDGRIRVGLKLNYDPSGTKIISTEVPPKGQGKVETLERLQQGYINFVKAGEVEKGAVNAADFQKGAEQGFVNRYGTSNIRAIWDNYDKIKAAQDSRQAGVAETSTTNYTATKTFRKGNKTVTAGYKDGKWYNLDTGEEVK